MFLGSRNETLRVLRLMGERLCVYTGGDWPHFCDCKCGGPDDQPGSEQSGCPELASLYTVVSTMTDKEWRAIGMRQGSVLVGEFQAALEEKTRSD